MTAVAHHIPVTDEVEEPDLGLLDAALWKTTGFHNAGLEISQAGNGNLLLTNTVAGTRSMSGMTLIGVSHKNFILSVRYQVTGWIDDATDKMMVGPAGRHNGVDGSSDQDFYTVLLRLFNGNETLHGRRYLNGGSSNLSINATLDGSFMVNPIDVELTVNGDQISYRYKLASSGTWIQGPTATNTDITAAGNIGVMGNVGGLYEVEVSRVILTPLPD